MAKARRIFQAAGRSSVAMDYVNASGDFGQEPNCAELTAGDRASWRAWRLRQAVMRLEPKSDPSSLRSSG